MLFHKTWESTKYKNSSYVVNRNVIHSWICTRGKSYRMYITMKALMILCFKWRKKDLLVLSFSFAEINDHFHYF